MKLMHTTTTTLSTKEFNKLSEKITDSLYALNPDIQDLYDIHINYIADSWEIDFVPVGSDIPAILADVYTEQHSSGEVLKITPGNLTNIPGILKFKNNNKSYELCMNYVTIFEFLLALYDFEYQLS